MRKYKILTSFHLPSRIYAFSIYHKTQSCSQCAKVTIKLDCNADYYIPVCLVHQENTNSIRLLNAALVNGYSIVTYQRSLRAADELDRAVLTNASQPIIWALGPLNSRDEVSYHSHFTKVYTHSATVYLSIYKQCVFVI